MAFTAAPMASNSASVDLSLLEVEEIFVEFFDCPLFYSVTLAWLQRWQRQMKDVHEQGMAKDCKGGERTLFKRLMDRQRYLSRKLL